MTPVIVDVDVAGHPYPVVLGPDYSGLGQALAARSRPGRCVVVSNPVVAPLYLTPVVAELRTAGFEPVSVLIPDGEGAKNLETWAKLVEELLDAGVDRRTPVLALGGGVTGDLVGFAAATTLRGLPFVQLPTTLLAMVDASVGGKTGLNTRQGKNLVGAFHQPILVWGALHALQTLPAHAWRCGLGEIVKHALIAGEPALVSLESQATTLARGPGPEIGALIAESIRTKATIVAEDPLEQGRRAILNLGHTLAHAIERVAGPPERGGVAHGEAVVLGLVAVTRLARERGWLEAPELPDRLDVLLERLGLSRRATGAWEIDTLAAAAGFDKKRERGKVKLIIPTAPGRVEIHEVPLGELRALARALPGVQTEAR